MITLVIGPGYTGSRVLERLPADSAMALGRSLTGDGHLDLDSDAPPVELPAPRSVIYPVPPASGQSGDARLRRFMDRLPQEPQRFVYLSTTGVYGNRDGAIVDETSEPQPESERSQRRLEAETLLQDWCRERLTTPIILRVPESTGRAAWVSIAYGRERRYLTNKTQTRATAFTSTISSPVVSLRCRPRCREGFTT